jgi:uncharacterized protein (TIGR02246 family)
MNRHFRHFRHTAALALLFAIALPAAAQGGAQIVDAAWKKAALANDAEALVKLYTPEAVAWLPDMPEARGTEAIRAAYRGLLGANTIKDVAFSDTTYRTLGNRSLGWGKVAVTLQPKAGGNPVVLNARFTVVAERRGKQWLYAVDHASTEPARK